jgi:hypothetical protein
MSRPSPADDVPHELRALVRELQAQPEPEAPEALLARIQDSRASGVRVLLPAAAVTDAADMAVHTPDSTKHWRGWMLAAGLASIGALALWRASDAPLTPAMAARTATADTTQPTGTADEATPAAPGKSNELSALISPWPMIAYAQSPTLRRDSAYAPITSVDTRRLAPGTRAYVRLSANAYHDMVPHQSYETQLERVRVDGQPAWRIITLNSFNYALRSAQEQLRRTVDTLWLRDSDLRPIERRMSMSILRSRVRYSDSLLVERDTIILPPGFTAGTRVPFRVGRTLALDRSRIFVPSEAALRLVLRAVPLSATWRGSVGVLSGDSRMFAVGNAQYLNLRVAGVDTVQTFGGRYACWRVELDTGKKPDVWFVSQETGETILTDGAYDVSYPQSRNYLTGGFDETRRIPPVRIRP